MMDSNILFDLCVFFFNFSAAALYWPLLNVVFYIFILVYSKFSAFAHFAQQIKQKLIKIHFRLENKLREPSQIYK